jgi:Tol biopolymer transport system component
MDMQRNKQQVAGTKNVLLPAWTSDGSKIAYLERTGRNKYDLYVAAVKQ